VGGAGVSVLISSGCQDTRNKVPKDILPESGAPEDGSPVGLLSPLLRQKVEPLVPEGFAMAPGIEPKKEAQDSPLERGEGTSG
jgi:hypothetical protein